MSYYDSLILPLNPPGRGDFAGFRVVGYLARNELQIPLYGRRIDVNRYEYYTTNIVQPQVQIPIITKNGSPLLPGKVVYVPGIGKFYVILYGPGFGSYAPY